MLTAVTEFKSPSNRIVSAFIKASWAERYILTLKRRLYMMLRSELSKDWIHYLPIVTNSLNNSPLESLGFLKPSDIRTEADSIKVDQAPQAD